MKCTRVGLLAVLLAGIAYAQVGSHGWAVLMQAASKMGVVVFTCPEGEKDTTTDTYICGTYEYGERLFRKDADHAFSSAVLTTPWKRYGDGGVGRVYGFNSGHVVVLYGPSGVVLLTWTYDAAPSRN